MDIIAFGHKKRCGKNTAATYAAQRLKYHFPDAWIRVTSFAWKIKDVANQLYRWAGVQTPEYYEDHQDEKEKRLPSIGMSPRELYVRLGTNAIREQVLGSTWVDYTLNQYNGASALRIDYLLITDLRFPNEFDAIKSRGGYCVKIVRTGEEFPSDPVDEALDEEDRWDAVITAKSSELGYLRNCVEGFVDKIIRTV